MRLTSRIVLIAAIALVAAGCGNDDGGSRSAAGGDDVDPQQLEIQLMRSAYASDSLLAQIRDGSGDPEPVREHFAEILDAAKEHPCVVVEHDELDMTVRDAVDSEIDDFEGWFLPEVEDARKSLDTIPECD